jgi:hypothetical protein
MIDHQMLSWTITYIPTIGEKIADVGCDVGLSLAMLIGLNF